MLATVFSISWLSSRSRWRSYMFVFPGCSKELPTQRVLVGAEIMNDIKD
jgi:hypothetical protein